VIIIIEYFYGYQERVLNEFFTENISILRILVMWNKVCSYFCLKFLISFLIHQEIKNTNLACPEFYQKKNSDQNRFSSKFIKKIYGYLLGSFKKKISFRTS
jgi:hypothetical protein